MKYLFILAIVLSTVSIFGAFTLHVEAQESTTTLVDDIIGLTNTIFVVAIPAVTGLIIAIAGLIGNKKIKDEAETVGQLAMTFSQKLLYYLQAYGPSVKYIESIVSKDLTPEQKAKLDLIRSNTKDIDQVIQAATAQLEVFRSKLPEKVNPDISLPDLPREQDFIKG